MAPANWEKYSERPAKKMPPLEGAANGVPGTGTLGRDQSASGLNGSNTVSITWITPLLALTFFSDGRVTIW